MSKSLRMRSSGGRSTAALAAVALVTVLAACGGGGGGGPTDTTVYASSTDVLVQDAPIMNVKVQDRNGGPGSQTANPILNESGLPTGRYRFESLPALPIKITSQTLVATDGTVKIAFSGGQWVSYIDTNVNNLIDPGEAVGPLSFQDLDGNGLFTQTADVIYTGRFNVSYVPPNAGVVQANIVASLVPANWNGTSSIGGLSAAAVSEALNTGPERSTNVQLKKTAALLTAISEALISNNLAAATDLPAVLTRVSQSSALSSTATPSQLAAAVAQALPTAQQADATRFVTNLKTVADSVPTAVTSNFESLIKVAINPDNTSTLKKTSLNSSDVTTLSTLVSSAASQSTEDKKQAAAAGPVDPEAAVISALRLVPWHELARLENSLPQDTTDPFRTIGRTTGFALSKNSSGSLSLKASGSPFTEALGAGTTTFTIPFVSTGANWQLFPSTNTGVVVDIKSGFQLPGTTTYVPGAMLRVCQANSGGCWPFMLASPAQVCSLMNSGTFKTNAALRADALSKINAVNSGLAPVACP